MNHAIRSKAALFAFLCVVFAPALSAAATSTVSTTTTIDFPTYGSTDFEVGFPPGRDGKDFVFLLAPFDTALGTLQSVSLSATVHFFVTGNIRSGTSNPSVVATGNNFGGLSLHYGATSLFSGTLNSFISCGGSHPPCQYTEGVSRVMSGSLALTAAQWDATGSSVRLSTFTSPVLYAGATMISIIEIDDAVSSVTATYTYAAPVPLPAGLPLLAAGALALGLAKRRRKV